MNPKSKQPNESEKEWGSGGLGEKKKICLTFIENLMIVNSDHSYSLANGLISKYNYYLN